EGIAPDFPGAIAVLREALAKTGDLTLYTMLPQVLVLNGERDEALTVVNKGLEQYPNTTRLLEGRKTAQISDPLQAWRQGIDDSDAKDIQKYIWKTLVYQQYNKPEDEAKMLAEAAKLDPNHPVVVEMQFHRALKSKNMDEAKRLAGVAQSKNLDHLGGLSFR